MSGEQPALSTAAVSDALDQLGIRGGVLGPGVTPIAPGWKAVGRAVTIGLRSTPAPMSPSLEAGFDALGPGEVAVILADDIAAATWGELLSRRAKACGASGVVTTGLVRDSAALRDLGFPVFAAGTSPVRPDGRAHVAALNEPLPLDDVMVNPGDLVVADDDGVVLVPQRAEVDVLVRAHRILRAERELRRETARTKDSCNG